MNKKQIIAELRDYGDLESKKLIGNAVSSRTFKAMLWWLAETEHLYNLKFRAKRLLCLLVAEALENEQ